MPDRSLITCCVTSGEAYETSAIDEKMVAEMPYPRNKPAYTRLEVEFGGSRMWIQPFPTGTDPENIWLRLDPATSRADAVRLPARFRAMSFTAARVYGVLRDADDVEHVQVYELPAIRK